MPLADCIGCGAARSREGRRTNVYCPDCRDHIRASKQRLGRKPSDAESARRKEMASLFIGGLTLQQIGVRFGVSRERVRQLIGKLGLRGKDGGSAKRGAANKQRNAAARKLRLDTRTLRKYGCDHATAVAINQGESFNKNGTPTKQFHNQHRSALVRNVPWEISLPEWVSVWRESGHYDERGRGRSGYCMARLGDKGAYAIGNVYITTAADNVRDYQADLKVRGVVCPDGYTRLPERAHQRSSKPRPISRGWCFIKRAKRNPYQAWDGSRYLGVFPTQEAAEAAVAAARKKHA